MTPAPPRLVITDELVAALVADQFPDLAGLEIGRHYTMRDHTVVRIGDHHGAYMPTVAGLDEYYARSTRLLQDHVDRWTFPHCAPQRTGLPGHGYPYHFQLTPWVTASNAAMVPLLPTEAGALGDALRQIHSPAHSPVRNPTTSPLLHTFAERFAQRLAGVSAMVSLEGHRLHADRIRAAWDEGVDASDESVRVWTHGYIAPRHLISDQGRFAGLVEWRFFAPGDPAGDIGPMLMLLPQDSHEDLLNAYGGASGALRARITARLLLACLWHLTDDDPFSARMAWHRLDELGLLEAA